MKKIISIILVAILAIAAMGLTTGCGDSAEFQRTEQLVNEIFDQLDEAFEELEASMDEDDTSAFFNRFHEVNTSIAEEMRRVQAEWAEMDLSADEEARLIEITNERLAYLMEKMQSLIP
ncbi:MAG: hypothetical protein FWD05_12030 [Oscillospiraceae bacterium]|nr:hypothetical protein [Oscillospiraceae bacterium]